MMEIRGAKNLKEVDEAYELVAKIFGPNYFEAREAKNHVRALEPLRDLEDGIVVVRGEEVVGFVRILDREFYSPAGVLKGGGISSVCIHPELRGQGWGVRVMDVAIERCRKRGDAFSVLFGRRAVDGWYPRFGYVGIGCHLEMRMEDSYTDSTFTSFSGNIQSGIFEFHSDLYAQAYDASYGDLLLSFCRGKEWWQKLEQRLARRVNAKDFITVMDGSDPIGYFILKEGRVIEAASLPDQQTNLLSGLLKFCIENNEGKVILALPSRHWCVHILRSLNHTLSVRYSWDGGHMIRILDKDSLQTMVLSSSKAQSHEAVNRLFDQHDVSQHQNARQLLLTIVGALPEVSRKVKNADPAILADSLLPMLPTWSIIDEL
jgi:predicted N-acetyltransferase YhbS